MEILLAWIFFKRSEEVSILVYSGQQSCTDRVSGCMTSERYSACNFCNSNSW